MRFLLHSYQSKYNANNFGGVFLILFVSVALFSCTKYTTPNKVSKSIVEDSWSISNFYFNGTSVTSEYTGDVFTFYDNGTVYLQGNTEFIGKWSVGLNKNPATLYLSSFLGVPLSNFNDDWTVESCSKKEIVLSSGENEINLAKVD